MYKKGIKMENTNVEQMKMQTKNLADEKLEALKELFPNAVTEVIDENGEETVAIDKDILMQEISAKVVEGNEERYQFTWPDKKKSILAANAPTTKTLRPCKEESVNFDTTENLYIEGDNLEVLKLLQETYLGKIKMIYIDPPYNTGKDFVYEDDFKQSVEEYMENSGQYDEEGNRLFENKESNGRFHTDWLNMMYSRLKLARNLLSDDGVIFISIDDNEQANLKKICDEIFGESNFVFEMIRKTKSKTNDAKTGINLQHENCLVYSKNKEMLSLFGGIKNLKVYNNPDNDINGDWKPGDPTAKSGTLEKNYFPVKNPYTGKIDFPSEGRYWVFSKNTIDKHIKSGRLKFKKAHKPNERGFIYKTYKNNLKTLKKVFDSLFFTSDDYMNQVATKELKVLGMSEYFKYPKGVDFMKRILTHSTQEDSIILDFFSGSATTAHATMQLNAEDGGKRKYIMVQIPEETAKDSEAYKAGYKNICEIGKERIRRAGKKILEENKDKEGIENLDTGFRVLKVDSSNMKDVYYAPQELNKKDVFSYVDNIKEDRSSTDLLFQVMLDLGISLSSKIEEKDISGKKVFTVDGNFLIACFDSDIDDEVINNIAEKKPVFAVFKNKSFTKDSPLANLEEIFKTVSPDTVRKVL